MESISYQEMRRARRRRPVRALRRLAMLFIQLLPLVLLAGFLARLLLEE